MEKFSLSDRYRLEFHWESVRYDFEGLCFFDKAYFSGPVLQEALRLNDDDHIMLDFFSQYFVIVNTVYVAKLHWKGVIYDNNGRIYFNDVSMSHDTELNKVPKLSNNDYLVIDTKGHEVKNHPFNLVYKTYVVNADTQLYNFGEK